MTIVTEMIVAPRPHQPLNERDVRSTEFGIEDMPVLQPHPSSLPPERPNARRSYSDPSAKSVDPRPRTDAPTPPASPPQAAAAPVQAQPSPPPAVSPAPTPTSEPDDDWGEGIL